MLSIYSMSMDTCLIVLPRDGRRERKLRWALDIENALESKAYA